MTYASAFEQFIGILEDLDQALDQNVEWAYRMKQRIREIRQAYQEGKELQTVVHEEDRPLITDLLRWAHESLGAQNSQVRRFEISTLHAEGVSPSTIASLLTETEAYVLLLLKEQGRIFESKPREDRL